MTIDLPLSPRAGTTAKSHLPPTYVDPLSPLRHQFRVLRSGPSGNLIGQSLQCGRAVNLQEQPVGRGPFKAGGRERELSACLRGFGDSCFQRRRCGCRVLRQVERDMCQTALGMERGHPPGGEIDARLFHSLNDGWRGKCRVGYLAARLVSLQIQRAFPGATLQDSSPIVKKLRSSICSRVTTLTDCGISRRSAGAFPATVAFLGA